MPDDPAQVQPHARPELESDSGSPSPSAPPAEGTGDLDLLTIGLVVFFLALIGIVVAMLLLTTL